MLLLKLTHDDRPIRYAAAAFLLSELNCWEWGVGVMVVVGDKGGEREREGAEGSVLYTSCWIYVLLVSKLLARS